MLDHCFQECPLVPQEWLFRIQSTFQHLGHTDWCVPKIDNTGLSRELLVLFSPTSIAFLLTPLPRFGEGGILRLVDLLLRGPELLLARFNCFPEDRLCCIFGLSFFSPDTRFRSAIGVGVLPERGLFCSFSCRSSDSPPPRHCDVGGCVVFFLRLFFGLATSVFNLVVSVSSDFSSSGLGSDRCFFLCSRLLRTILLLSFRTIKS